MFAKATRQAQCNLKNITHCLWNQHPWLQTMETSVCQFCDMLISWIQRFPQSLTPECFSPVIVQDCSGTFSIHVLPLPAQHLHNAPAATHIQLSQKLAACGLIAHCSGFIPLTNSNRLTHSAEIWFLLSLGTSPCQGFLYAANAVTVIQLPQLYSTFNSILSSLVQTYLLDKAQARGQTDT